MFHFWEKSQTSIGSGCWQDISCRSFEEKVLKTRTSERILFLLKGRRPAEV